MQENLNETATDYECEVEERVKDAADCVTSNFDEISKITKKAAMDTLNQVQKDMKKYFEKGQEQLQTAEEKMEKTIKQYPLRSLLVAAGVGFTIGLISRK